MHRYAFEHPAGLEKPEAQAVTNAFWNRHKRPIAVVAWVILAVLFGAALFGDRGLLRYQMLNEEKHRIEGAIEARKRANRDLIQELEALRHDEAYQERLARETLNFVRPGEIVYRFPDTPSPSPPPANAIARDLPDHAATP